MMRVIPLLAILSLLTACKWEGEKVNGYVEAEYVYIAATSAGILKTLSVARGQQVEPGQELFSLDLTSLKSAYDAAQAEAAQAKARLDNLTKGLRPEEIEVIAKQKEQAVARLKNTEVEYLRYKKLVETGAASKSTFDEKESTYQIAKDRVEELEAQLKTAKLGGREDERRAAEAAVDAANQKVIQTRKSLEEISPKAPVAARVEDTMYRVGEFVSAGTPIVNLLPPENIKIRFFVSQKILPQMSLGKKITINCDGCKTSLSAKISFVASQAEFTPPVIYSVGSRDKLVFMVEAIPEERDDQLRPGLPVDVTLGR